MKVVNVMKSKEIIIETYKKLVLENKSTKITVKEICEDASVSRTTFYKYFKDSYHIMEAILVDDSISLLKKLLELRVDSFSVTKAWYIDFYKKKELCYYAIKDESQNSLFNTLIHKLTELNCEIYKDVYTTDLIEYYAYKYAALQAMLLKKWILDGMKLPASTMAEIFLHDIMSDQDDVYQKL